VFFLSKNKVIGAINQLMMAFAYKAAPPIRPHHNPVQDRI